MKQKQNNGTRLRVTPSKYGSNNILFKPNTTKPTSIKSQQRKRGENYCCLGLLELNNLVREREREREKKDRIFGHSKYYFAVNVLPAYKPNTKS